MDGGGREVLQSSENMAPFYTHTKQFANLILKDALVGERRDMRHSSSRRFSCSAMRYGSHGGSSDKWWCYERRGSHLRLTKRRLHATLFHK